MGDYIVHARITATTCLRCGALVAAEYDTALHDAWHERLEATETVTLTTSDVATLTGELGELEIGPDRIHLAAARLIGTYDASWAQQVMYQLPAPFWSAFQELHRAVSVELSPARIYGDGLSAAEGSATDGPR